MLCVVSITPGQGEMISFMAADPHPGGGGGKSHAAGWSDHWTEAQIDLTQGY